MTICFVPSSLCSRLSMCWYLSYFLCQNSPLLFHTYYRHLIKIKLKCLLNLMIGKQTCKQTGIFRDSKSEVCSNSWNEIVIAINFHYNNNQLLCFHFIVFLLPWHSLFMIKFVWSCLIMFIFLSHFMVQVDDFISVAHRISCKIQLKSTINNYNLFKKAKRYIFILENIQLNKYQNICLPGCGSLWHTFL